MILIDGPSQEPGSIRSHTSKNTLQGVSFGEQVFHQVIDRNIFCMLPAQTFETNYRGKRWSKTALKSLPATPKVLLNFLIIFAITVGAQALYADLLLDMTLNDDSLSIKSIQKSTAKWLQEFMRAQTSLGGGAELSTFMFFVLLFMPRSRFFYYVVVTGLKGALSFQLKMLYAEPRPYHLDSAIHPNKCKPTFGNPSGHSMAASVSAIVIFLDVFHGTPVTY